MTITPDADIKNADWSKSTDDSFISVVGDASGYRQARDIERLSALVMGSKFFSGPKPNRDKKGHWIPSDRSKASVVFGKCSKCNNGTLLRKSDHGKCRRCAKSPLSPERPEMKVMSNVQHPGDGIDFENWDGQGSVFGRCKRCGQRANLHLNVCKRCAKRKSSVNKVKPEVAEVRLMSVLRMESIHAPKGGVTIKGKFYKGGEFIPSDVAEEAGIKNQEDVERRKSTGSTPPPSEVDLEDAYARAMKKRRLKTKSEEERRQKNYEQNRKRFLKTVTENLYDDSSPFLQIEEENQDYYLDEMEGVLDYLNPRAMREIAKRVSGIEWFNDTFDLTAELKSSFINFSKWGIPDNATVAGMYDSSTNKLWLDGDGLLGRVPNPLAGKTGAVREMLKARGGEQSPAHVYAHELGHVLDHGGRISQRVSWREAWKKEISFDGPDDDAPLTRYAATNPSEGFAEFVRLAIFHSDVAKKDFPECWSEWEASGYAD